MAAMNIALTRAAEGFPRRAFSAQDIRRMIDAGVIAENENIELVGGEIVVMSPKGYAHDLIKNTLNIAIARALPQGTTLGIETTIQFSDDTILEPDLAVFKRSSLIESEARFSQLLPGQLLLAIEVAVSSLAYDKGLKARLCARQGVREYWVIDANKRVTLVHTGPTENGWSSILERAADETLVTPALPNFAVKLSEIG
jgi:Uma2 family endonuclease